MKTAKEIRVENINALVDKVGGRMSLATKLGFDDTSYINQLCKGHGSFGNNAARKIENKLGLEEGWMDVIHNHQRDFANESALSHKSLGDLVPILGYVPLISWVQAGDWHEPIDNFHPGDGDDMLPCPVPHSDYTYCVQVSGESMIDEYPEGYIIFVDPKLEPKHKDDVIVRLLPENEVTFKRLMVEGNKKYLKAMNKNWPNPIIPINGDAEFCGVVIFAGKYPRK